MDGAELKQVIRYHGYCARAYKDPRLTGHVGLAGRHSMREVILAALWVIAVERPEGEGKHWRRIREILGLAEDRLGWIFRDDVPRWEPDQPYEVLCEVPTPRKLACGKRGTWQGRVTNPADGTWRRAGFCTRHENEGREAFAAERQLHAPGMQLPVPVPNRGGLLPCYIGGNWEPVYAHADPGWTVPPAGICADNWPAAAKLAAAATPPARLKLIRGDGLIRDALQLTPPKLIPVP